MNTIIFGVLILSFVSLSQSFMPRNINRVSRISLKSEEKNVWHKPDLIESIKDSTGISKKDVESVLEAFKHAIRNEVLGSGKEIRIRDFGTFKQKLTAARVGRNPRTGESLQIPSVKSVSFSVSGSLKIKGDGVVVEED